MNPMSGPQNPAPPYNRPAGPNQQAQNSQYHQVNIGGRKKWIFRTHYSSLTPVYNSNTFFV